MATGTSLGGALKPGPSGIRLGGGVNPDQALFAERGNLSLPMLREKLKWEIPARARVPMWSTGTEQSVVGMKAL